MGIFFIGFLMGSRPRMRMIVLVDLMRVFGGSLGRMISLVSVCWVRTISCYQLGGWKSGGE